MATAETTTYYESRDAFFAEAVRRFGDDQMEWRFICPSCGHVQSVRAMRAAGMAWDAIGFSCIGRYEQSVGCQYAGGVPHNFSPVRLGDSPHRYFDLAAAL